MTAPKLFAQIQGQGAVSADNLNTFAQTCDNVGQLRAFVGLQGIGVFTRGLATPNDGGAGSYYWDTSAIGPDDGINVIVPTGSASGAWVRVVEFAIGQQEPYGFVTTAALLLAFALTVSLPTGTIAFTTGRTSEGDGGGGEYYYDAADTASADNGGTIRVDSAGRRWRAIVNNAVQVQLFGAGGADSSSAFNNAIAWANVSGFTVDGNAQTFLFVNPITTELDLANTRLTNMTLNFTAVTTAGPVLQITTSATDANEQPQRDNVHPFENFRMLGPAVTIASAVVDGIEFVPITDSGSEPQVAGFGWINGGIQGFRDQVVIGNGVAVHTSFTNCYFATLYDSSGPRARAAVALRNGNTNTAERIVFNTCSFINGNCVVWDQIGSPNADIYFVGPNSIDAYNYLAVGGANVPSGATACDANIIVSGHLEFNGQTTDYFWNIAQTLSFLPGTRLVSSNSPLGTHSWGYVQSSGTVSIVGATFNDNTPVTAQWLIDGPGTVITGNNMTVGNTVLNLSSQGGNLVPRFTLPDSASFGNWTVTGVTRSGSNLCPSTNPVPLGSLSFAANGFAYIEFPCAPGQIFGASLYATVSNVAGATLTAQLIYMDATSEVLADAQVIVPANTAYATLPVYINGGPFHAPAGTSKCRYIISLSNIGAETANVCLAASWRM